MTLVIKPKGALALSNRPIPSPGTMTAYVSLSLALPLPTTVLGALGRALGVTLSQSDVMKDWGLGELLEEISKRLGCKLRLWGPLVRVTEKNSQTMYIPMEDSLVESSLAPLAAESVIKKWIGTEAEGIKVRTIRPWLESKIGIGLKRSTKTTARGYLYISQYSIPVIGKQAEYLYFTGCNLKGIKKLVRFGGESRLALLKGGEENLKLQKPERSRVFILLSHAILPTMNVRTISVEELKLVPEQAKVSYVLGRVEALALGFNQVVGRRRPIRFSLKPGTLVILNKEVKADKIWMGELIEYGFGSMTSVNIDVSNLFA